MLVRVCKIHVLYAPRGPRGHAQAPFLPFLQHLLCIALPGPIVATILNGHHSATSHSARGLLGGEKSPLMEAAWVG